MNIIVNESSGGDENEVELGECGGKAECHCKGRATRGGTKNQLE